MDRIPSFQSRLRKNIVTVPEVINECSGSHSLILASDKSILCGVGGGLTNGERSINLAIDAEFQGALGVVLNKPTSNDLIKRLKNKIDIPTD